MAAAAPDGVDGSLTPPQREVVACGLLTSGFDCVLQMPTGSGKTWLAEHAIAGTLSAGRRAVYLSPLRALAAELGERWRGRFAPHPVGVFTGDHGPDRGASAASFRAARLLVMTPERLDACTRSWRAHWAWLPETDLVVVDEFHLLGDRHRGPRLEGALGRVRRLNPFLRLLCLSATLGNRAELADWLGAVEYASAWRPVPLRWRVLRYRKAADKPDLLRGAVADNLSGGGKTLVFVQSRRRSEELSRFLQDAGVRAAHHHAGQDHDDRRQVEGRFRNLELDVVVATATLEMGLNLPVRQVVLYDLQAFDGQRFSPLPCAHVWQRGGRAGRPGLDAEGEVVLLAPSWDRAAGRYPRGDFEPIRSGLADRRALAEQVVVEVAGGLARSPVQLARVFAASLAGHQRSLPDVDAVIAEMCAAGMLRRVARDEEGRAAPRLQATRLGWIATRHFLAPASVLLFRRVLEAGQGWTFLDLLLLAACADDCEPILPADFEELERLAGLLSRERSALLRRSRADLGGLLGAAGQRLLGALKTALAARDWTRTGSAEQTAESLGCYPFEVRRLQESVGRLLAAMAALSEAEGPEGPARAAGDDVSVRERLHVLRRMVAAGLDEEAATLTLIPGVGPEMARRLRAAGVEDLEALAQAEPGDLRGVRGLSAGRARGWIAQAVDLVPTRSAYRYREAGPAVGVPAGGWPADVDPYRLRRALDLRVQEGDGGDYRVSGGLEPHRVRVRPGPWACDCADAGQGRLCKHVLAVRLHRGDGELRALVGRLKAGQADGPVDLFDLWFDRGVAAEGPR